LACRCWYTLSMASVEVRYTTVSTVMRAPRVVIMFPGNENWRRWVRLALRAASSTWGGGGHILVPYDESGTVHPDLQAAVRMYDPDHIVALEPSLAEREAIEPGSVQVSGEDGKPLVGDRREELIKNDGNLGWPDPLARRARDRLAAACTTFVEEYDGHRHSIVQSTNSTGEGLPGPSASEVIGPHAGDYLAVPEDWTSDFALLAAASIGMETDRTRSRAAAEPNPLDLLRFALGVEGAIPTSVPIEMLSTSNESPNAPPVGRFQLLDKDLKIVSRGYGRNRGGIVFGDTANDFALAHALRVTRGFGSWIPTGITESELFGDAMGPAVRRQWHPGRNSAAEYTATSTSMSPSLVDELVVRLNSAMDPYCVTSDPQGRFTPSRTIDWNPGGRRMRVIGHGVGDSFVVPVERSESGTMTMAAPFSLPVAPTPRIKDDSQPYWYVDVEFADGHMPRGRSLSPTALVAGPRADETVARSGQDGITVETQSMGLVVAGAFIAGSMPRPMLRELGVRDWVEAMARAAGLTTRYSTPGQHAHLVASRLGSRSALLDLASGPLRKALESFRFARTGQARNVIKSALDDGIDRLVVLEDRPFATFARLQYLSPGANTRQLLDTLCDVRLARRGLILHCVECGRPSFVSVDNLGQSYDCPRCGATNTLAQSRWRLPEGEPLWFYDLHNSFRELLSTGGDVPLLAGAALRKSTRTYSDCPEVEFLDATGTRVAEIDLIAHADRQLIIAEAKTSSSLGPSAAKRADSAKKLARIAAVLRADVVLLASSADTPWPPTTVAELEAALSASTGSLETPEVRTMTSL